jgi:hypothetical protein
MEANITASIEKCWMMSHYGYVMAP